MQFHVRPALAAIALLSVASASVPAIAVARASDGLSSVDHSGSGHILRGSLGMQPSLRAATVALLTRVHRALGSRPTVVKILQNTAQHTVAVVFTGTHGGKPISGLSIVTAAPGVPASGAAVYDTTANFPKTASALLRDLSAAAPSGAATQRSVAMAPAEPLIPHPFGDNTGTISLPANWTLKAAGGGSAYAVGPSGELVNYQQPLRAADPSYGFGQMLANGTGFYADPTRRTQGLQSMALIPYTGDPVQAWTRGFDQIAMQTTHRHGTQFIVDSVKPINETLGQRVDFIGGHATITGGAYSPGDVAYFAYVTVLSKDPMGTYMIVRSYCIIPKKSLAAQGVTAAAVFNSVRINMNQVNANMRAFNNMMQQQFESEIANQQEQNQLREESTQASIANQNANQDAMQKQAAGMENYVLDRAVVVNPSTGGHERIENLSSGIVPGYQVVPPGGYIKGVDY